MMRPTLLLAWCLGTAALAACHDRDGPDLTSPGEMSLSVSAPTVPADGASTVRVSARIAARAASDHRTLTFSTTAGAFEGATSSASIAVDNAGAAVATLRAPNEVGVARIRVSQGDVVRQDSVVFVRAEAEQVLVEPDHFSVQAGTQNEVRVTVYLRRARGKVTPGAEVRFRAVRQDTGEEVGRFGVPGTSDASGVVTVRYTPGETAYRGPLLITATTMVGGQPGASGSTTVDVSG